MAHRLGVHLSPDKPVASIGLGSLAVSPLDMAAAYATFPALGIYAKPMAITQGDPAGRPRRHELRLGQAADQARALAGRRLEGERRAAAERALRDGRRLRRRHPRQRRQDGDDRQPRGRLVRRLHAQLATVVWMGYPRGEIPMLDVHGVAVAGATFPVPIWHEYMVAALWHRKALVVRPAEQVPDVARPDAAAITAASATTRPRRPRRRRPPLRPRRRRRLRRRHPAPTTVAPKPPSHTTTATRPPRRPPTTPRGSDDDGAARRRPPRRRHLPLAKSRSALAAGALTLRARRRARRRRVGARARRSCPLPGGHLASDAGLFLDALRRRRSSRTSSALVLVRRGARFGHVFVLACAIQLAPLAGPVFLSSDAWTYWSYARVHDPYTNTPSDDRVAARYAGIGVPARDLRLRAGVLARLPAGGADDVAGARCMALSRERRPVRSRDDLARRAAPRLRGGARRLEPARRDALRGRRPQRRADDGARRGGARAGRAQACAGRGCRLGARDPRQVGAVAPVAAPRARGAGDRPAGRAPRVRRRGRRDARCRDAPLALPLAARGHAADARRAPRDALRAPAPPRAACLDSARRVRRRLRRGCCGRRLAAGRGSAWPSACCCSRFRT